MNGNINDPAKSIATFYAGQSIFLTGATGFLGKVYIEKILRSCPDVREIFLLLRSKKGQSVNKRLEKILSLPILSSSFCGVPRITFFQHFIRYVMRAFEFTKIATNFAIIDPFRRC